MRGPRGGAFSASTDFCIFCSADFLMSAIMVTLFFGGWLRPFPNIAWLSFLGLIPGWGGAWLLPNLIGPAKIAAHEFQGELLKQIIRRVRVPQSVPAHCAASRLPW